MEPLFESREVRFRTSWIPVPLVPGAFSSLGFLLFCVVAALAGQRPAIPFLFVGTAAAVASAFLPPRVRSGTLRIDAAGAHWNGTLVAARGRIPRGTLRPESPQGATVALERGVGRTPREFVMRDIAEGRAVLHALGLDASQVAASFRGRSVLFPAPIVALPLPLLILGAVLLHHYSLAKLLLCAVPAMVVLFAWPTRVVVGSDGVLRRWMGTRRFVAYRDIARIDLDDAGLTLVQRKGRPVMLPVGPAMMVGGNASAHQRAQILAEQDALVERIRQAMEAEPTAAPALEPTLLARRGRTAGEWHAALRALAGRAEGGMRAAPVLPEQLWACVDDPSAEPTVRAGAAAVLATEAAPGTRERLRVAAQLVAQPRLRVALEAAADGRDDALTAALSRVEDDAVRTAR